MSDYQPAKTSPKDFFMHLLSIVTLYGSAISFGTLLFQFINRWFPDPLQMQDYYYTVSASAIRNALSVLIIFFPVYLWVAWTIHKEYFDYAEKRGLRVRKWLTHFTLFAAAVIVMGDLVVLVRHLLEGDLTIRFILKVLTVLVIASAVFGFYLWELKKYSTN